MPKTKRRTLCRKSPGRPFHWRRFRFSSRFLKPEFSPKKIHDAYAYYTNNNEFDRDIVVNEDGCFLTGGYAAYLVAKMMGLKEVPVLSVWISPKCKSKSSKKLEDPKKKKRLKSLATNTDYGIIGTPTAITDYNGEQLCVGDEVFWVDTSSHSLRYDSNLVCQYRAGIGFIMGWQDVSDDARCGRFSFSGRDILFFKNVGWEELLSGYKNIFAVVEE